MLRNANHTLAFSRFDTGFSSSFVHKDFHSFDLKTRLKEWIICWVNIHFKALQESRHCSGLRCRKSTSKKILIFFWHTSFIITNMECALYMYMYTNFHSRTSIVELWNFGMECTQNETVICCLEIGMLVSFRTHDIMHPHEMANNNRVLCQI